DRGRTPVEAAGQSGDGHVGHGLLSWRWARGVPQWGAQWRGPVVSQWDIVFNFSTNALNVARLGFMAPPVVVLFAVVTVPGMSGSTDAVRYAMISCPAGVKM